MSTRPPAPPEDGDARALARLGYGQELRRRLGGFSSFAIGFSVISVLTGVTSTFGDALAAGGPAGLALGWPLVAAGTLVVALGMAELASAFPTAGALYHWSSILGGPGWGWLTAMLNLSGQIAIVAAIDLACAQAAAQLLGWRGLDLPLFWAILAAHGALNAASVRLVAWLNDASAAVHLVGVVALSGLLFGHAARGPGVLVSGVPSAAGFVQALVLGVWTFTGFDAAAHVSEETHDPARKAPRGIVGAVGASAVAGWLFVVALLVAMPDAGVVAGQPDAALSVLRAALGDGAGRAAMSLAVLAMWFAGLSSVTGASRMLFAFARDGGLPLARWLRRVEPRTATPVVATAACCAGAGALVTATSRASSSVFLAVAALATVALYASYVLPIGLGTRARAAGRWGRRGPWSLGAASGPVAGLSVAWAGLVLVVCGLANPLSLGLFGGLLAALGVLWLGPVRGRFAGPPLPEGYDARPAASSAPPRAS